jgi:TPR repeat protein
MFEHGLGSAIDLRLAAYWYEQAALGGDEAAPGKLRELRERLQPEPAGRRPDT